MQYRQSNLSYKRLVKLNKNPNEQVVVTTLIRRNLVGHLGRGGSDCAECGVTYRLPSEGDLSPMMQLSSNYQRDFSF